MIIQSPYTKKCCGKDFWTGFLQEIRDQSLDVASLITEDSSKTKKQKC